MVAYEFYRRDDYVHGRDLDHWLEAEKSIHSKEAAVVGARSSVSRKTTASGPAKKKVAARGTKKIDDGQTAGNMTIKAKSAKNGSRKKEK